MITSGCPTPDEGNQLVRFQWINHDPVRVISRPVRQFESTDNGYQVLIHFTFLGMDSAPRPHLS
jgi:hypothetical protein